MIVIPLKEALEAVDEIAARNQNPAVAAVLKEVREKVEDCTQLPMSDD